MARTKPMKKYKHRGTHLVVSVFSGPLVAASKRERKKKTAEIGKPEPVKESRDATRTAATPISRSRAVHLVFGDALVLVKVAVPEGAAEPVPVGTDQDRASGGGVFDHAKITVDYNKPFAEGASDFALAMGPAVVKQFGTVAPAPPELRQEAFNSEVSATAGGGAGASSYMSFFGSFEPGFETGQRITIF
ncbi:hypothetical protein DFJ73DRAFT_769154 [Zopfochytrium polystomum]|nr:hypothetical protein DFJ73DRAFT_769154 [Zopfochytrium polystomum]